MERGKQKYEHILKPIINAAIKIQETNEEEEHSSTVTKHFSHPHALELCEVQEANKIICSGCEDLLCGTAYKCTISNCNFTLHKSCFELPRKMQHNSHPNHPLTLYPTLPQRDSFYFGCHACGGEPKSFVYECLQCNFSLHAICATSLPQNVTREDHQHPLALQYKWPFPIDDYVRIFCAICNGLCVDSLWLYYCAQCKLGTHVQCATVKKEDGSSLENNSVAQEEENMTDEQKLFRATIRAQDEQARLNLQTQMAYMNAKTMANMFRTTYRYY